MIFERDPFDSNAQMLHINKFTSGNFSFPSIRKTKLYILEEVFITNVKYEHVCTY